MKSRLEEIADAHATVVLHSSIALVIERIASEAAADILRDPAFRAELKAIARGSVEQARRNLARARRTRKRAE